MNDQQETIRERAAKLREMATRGTKHEKKIAQVKLDQLLQKYGLKEEDLSSNKIVAAEYSYASKTERNLLMQIMYKIRGEPTPFWKTGARKLVVKVTTIEATEIGELFNYYRKALAQEMKTLLLAFYQRHHIFPDGPGVDDPTEEQRREWQCAAMMRHGLQSKEYIPSRRQIERGE